MQELRFVVSVDAQWQVVIDCPQLTTGQPARAMQKLDDGEGGCFPLPPAAEAAAVAQQDLPCKDFCLNTAAPALRKARDQIIDRDVECGQVRAFGGYLFLALIGAQRWDWIRQTAAGAGARCIELALTWDDHDGNLNRLNWEMMHDGQAFLAGGLPGVAVAITRRVLGTRGEQWQPRSFDFPPKILFVVGSALNDPSIRPGAEFLGLLRELEDSGRRVRARVLERTQPRELERAVEEFRPDVVHFICHGDWDGQRQRGYLKLAPDETSLDGYRDADQIYDAIAPGYIPPPIVLLSACRTGSAHNGGSVMLQGAHELAPLATELVRRGVPVVLGMAGRVSDQACRLFTRRFGSALVQGGSLVAATAEARRATVTQGSSAEDSVDWAFPTLFMAEQLDPGYSPVPPGSVLQETKQEAWITSYNLSTNPVFCGRNEFFKAYYGFFGPNPKRVLAIKATADAGVGKTRLLKELGKQMLRDGHVPVMLTSDSQKWTPPTSLQALARSMDRAIKRTRRHLGFESATDSQLTLLMNWITDPDSSQPPAVPDLDYWLGDSGEMTSLALRLTLQLDLSQLMKDARANEFIRQSNGQAMVLLDSAEQYGPLQDELLSGDLLDGWGLGNEAEPVPVVLAFAGTQPAGVEVMSVVEKVRQTWFNPLPLAPFDHGSEEDLLAYCWIALNPFSTRLPDRYVLNERATPEIISSAREGLEVFFQGLPMNLADPARLSDFTKMFLAGGFVKQFGVDDEDRQILAAARIAPEVIR
jgi:CHAT domain